MSINVSKLLEIADRMDRVAQDVRKRAIMDDHAKANQACYLECEASRLRSEAANIRTVAGLERKKKGRS